MTPDPLRDTLVELALMLKEAFVSVPHAMSFILMKLFAFRDRVASSNNDYGAYHAFDVLQIVDSMNRLEWEQGRPLIGEPEAAATVTKAREIVATLFDSSRSEGSIRLFEYARNQQGVSLTVALLELFVKELSELIAV